MTSRTRYADEGFESLVPRELWIDVRGLATSLVAAVNAFTNVSMFFTTILSFCANGYAGDCQCHLAYDDTPGLQEREFFEQFVQDERGAPRPSRRIKSKVITEVIKSLGTHEHSERLQRALGQYVLALKYWMKGEEIQTVSHLYMGMEALVPIIRKNEITRLGLQNTTELANHMGINLEELDSTIRREILFKGDVECHRLAKKVSDGIEHGFLGYDEIRPLAINARNTTAKYLRHAIISLLYLPDEIEQEMLGSKHNKPIGMEDYIRYLWGTLISNGDRFAHEDLEYPMVDWKFSVTSFTQTENDELRITFSQSLTPRLAKNVSFRPERFEVFGPEGVITNPPPKTTTLEPEIVSNQPTFKPTSKEELAQLLDRAIQDGNFEEMRIRTKDGQTLVVKADFEETQ